LFSAPVLPSLTPVLPSREVPRIQWRLLAKPLAYYLRLPDRRKAVALAYRAGGYTMQQIADAFGVHYATVSRTVRAAEEVEKGGTPMLDGKA
jgi:putative transposase